MRKFLSVAAVAAFLTGGGIAAVQAACRASAAPTGYVQMNSPGDGLDGRRAAREGNARPSRMGGMRYRGYRWRYRRWHRRFR